jgi:hypothetical protein
LFLRGLAADQPQKLEAEVNNLNEAWQNSPVRAAEVLTVAVALLVSDDSELARCAGRLLTNLAERPGFRDDPRLRALLVWVPENLAAPIPENLAAP